MRRALTLAVLLLAACDRRAEMLEQEYNQAGTTAEQCRIAGQIAGIYLQKSDQSGYKKWSSTRDTDCLLASSGVYSTDPAPSAAADRAISDAQNIAADAESAAP